MLSQPNLVRAQVIKALEAVNDPDTPEAHRFPELNAATERSHHKPLH